MQPIKCNNPIEKILLQRDLEKTLAQIKEGERLKELFSADAKNLELMVELIKLRKQVKNLEEKLKQNI